MEIKTFHIEGLIEITPKLFEDERGFFFESFNAGVQEAVDDVKFVQDNQSFSKKGVLRGFHFQKPPFGQEKLVRVVRGSVLDVAVDIRKSSPTFGQNVSVVLDDKKNNMFYIPQGFAHAFLALEDCVLTYKCGNYYDKASEGGILWNDSEIEVNWGVEHPIVSAKDIELPKLKDLDFLFD